MGADSSCWQWKSRLVGETEGPPARGPTKPGRSCSWCWARFPLVLLVVPVKILPWKKPHGSEAVRTGTLPVVGSLTLLCTISETCWKKDTHRQLRTPTTANGIVIHAVHRSSPKTQKKLLMNFCNKKTSKVSLASLVPNFKLFFYVAFINRIQGIVKNSFSTFSSFPFYTSLFL